MIIIKTKGGLGNQMFQYAFGRALSIHQNTELIIDVNLESHIKGIKQDIERPFLLDHFNIAARRASKDEVVRLRSTLFLYLAKLWRKMTNYNYYLYDSSFLTKKGDCYIEGFWWQSEKYFKDIRDVLLRDFTIKNGFGAEAEKVAKSIGSAETPVSLHVRRGDYATDKATFAHHGLIPTEYYFDAMKLIIEKNPHPVFYVFSDDIEWVKTNLSFSYPVLFVSDENIPTHEELILMSLCTHHIIANSSFSWWGAWLGRNSEKIVIAPKRWISDETVDTSDIYPDSWIKI